MVCLVVIGGVVYFVNRGSQTLAQKYGMRVYAADQDRFNYMGFYHKEKWKAGVFRWSGRAGMVRVYGTGLVELRLACNTPELEGDPVFAGNTVFDNAVEEIRIFQRL